MNEIAIKTQDLPIWMQRARRGVDWGILLSLILGLVVTWPFIWQNSIPRTTSLENYAYRTADYANALREGYLYPRWSPHVAGGYGAPIPNYYPPGAPYSAAVIETLFTNETTLAIRIFYVIAFTIAAGATYTVVARWISPKAGILATGLYLLSPYIGFTVPYALGDMPAVAAHALLPLQLWAFGRLIDIQRPFDILSAALTTAMLIFTHPLNAIAGMVFILTLCLWRKWVKRRQTPWFSVFIALLTGVGIAAIYWWPAWGEYERVNWFSQPEAAPILRLNALELLKPMEQVDLSELIPTPQLRLGVAAIVFSILGIIGIISQWRRASFAGVYLLLGVAICVLGLTAFDNQVWLLGPIMFCLAVGGSAAICALERFRISPMTAFGLALIMVLSSTITVWLGPIWPASSNDYSPQAQIRYEQQGFGVAVLPQGSQIPLTIPPDLPPNRFVLNSYQLGQINKFPLNEISASRQATVLEHTSQRDIFQLQIQSPTTLVIQTAYFPGWEATVNGKPVALRPSENGLIEIDVPKTSNGELVIELKETPLRARAWAVSMASLVGVIALGLWRQRRQLGEFADLPLLPRSESRILAIVIAIFMGVIILFVIPNAPLSLRTTAGQKLLNATPIRARTDSGLELIAYQLERSEYHANETMSFTLYWRALRFQPENYRVQVYLQDERGIRWFQTTPRTPGYYPTRRWPTDHYISDPQYITISETAINGDYQIGLEVIQCEPDCARGERLRFFNAEGQIIGTQLLLPQTITIR